MKDLGGFSIKEIERGDEVIGDQIFYGKTGVDVQGGTWEG